MLGGRLLGYPSTVTWFPAANAVHCSSVTPPAFGEFEITVGAPSWNQSETMPLCRKTPRNGTDTTVPGINRAGVTSWNCVGMITVTMWIPGNTQFMHI